MIFNMVKKEYLSQVSPDKVFFLSLDVTGASKSIWSLEELLETLKELPDDVISHHIYNGKNDFAKWIRETIGDNELADELERIGNNREALLSAMERRINWLKKFFANHNHR